MLSIRKHLAFSASCLAAAALSPLAAAQGDLLYTTSGHELRVIDLLGATTVSTTQIVSSLPSGVDYVRGLAIQPGTGAMFVLVKPLDSSVRHLARLDPSTGMLTEIAPLPDLFSGLAFRADGTLFGITGIGAAVPETLYTIDPQTGVPTQEISVAAGAPNWDVGAITFAPDGFLYHATGIGIANVDEVFHRIDTVTDTVTVVPASGDSYDEFLCMTPYTGRNLVAVDHDDDLYIVTTDARVSWLGRLDHSDIKGIAYLPSPNSQPFFRPYGDGCLHVTNRIPMLVGSGVPSIGGHIAVDVVFAPKGSFGAVVFGYGHNALPVPSPTCELQVSPLLTGAAPFVTSIAGRYKLTVTIPVQTFPADFYLQAGVLGFNDFVLTNPLQMHVR